MFLCACFRLYNGILRVFLIHALQSRNLSVGECYVSSSRTFTQQARIRSKLSKKKRSGASTPSSTHRTCRRQNTNHQARPDMPSKNDEHTHKRCPPNGPLRINACETICAYCSTRARGGTHRDSATLKRDVYSIHINPTQGYKATHPNVVIQDFE